MISWEDDRLRLGRFSKMTTVAVLSKYKDDLAYSLYCLSAHPLCHISREGSHDQGHLAREMACWMMRTWIRDLSLPHWIPRYILLPARTQLHPSAGPRKSIHTEHVEGQKGSRKSFRVNEDLVNLELLHDYPSCWAMTRMAMAYRAWQLRVWNLNKCLQIHLQLVGYLLGLTWTVCGEHCSSGNALSEHSWQQNKILAMLLFRWN